MANTIIIGVIITVCSNNWMSMWIGLEISLISFIPFLYNKKRARSESIIKYFIIQSVASIIFLFRVIYILIGVSIINEIIITIAILIKLGSAPFHNWILIIIEYIDYLVIFVILTILKAPPLSILYQIDTGILTVPIVLRIIVRSVSCINQSSVRKTLAFSSIYNISLILTSINKFNVTITFLMIYIAIIAIFTVIVSIIKINFINQITFNEFNTWIKINLWIRILSLGGFPITIGFISKILILQNIIFNKEVTIIAILVITSLLVIIFYTRLAFTSILNFYTFKKWTLTKTEPVHFLIVINISITPITLTLIRIR